MPGKFAQTTSRLSNVAYESDPKALFPVRLGPLMLE